MAVASRKKNIRVLIADDHPLVAAGLRRYLSMCSGVTIVGHANDGDEAVAMATRLEPDVVLMDVDMPRVDGVEATRRLAKACPITKVVALSALGGEYIEAMTRVGAYGYVRKESPPSEVLAAIRAAVRGRAHFPDRAGTTVHGASTALLSEREREVLALIARGMASKDVAQELSIGVRTAETYRASISKKLGLSGSVALTRFAIAKGLIEPED